ncbi:hypothetical protein CVT24_009964 [Panaeolus cyanescens]|uniref:Nephrocystin 3-like N-terminal domain-containing protein n=1 Tax=Panaeolus cyanescens TaxID=181874 RepID=A0A409VXF8_9AGAR|nr:hypothetical protein CVT24_009964 [Panaeolus cyanescens]
MGVPNPTSNECTQPSTALQPMQAQRPNKLVVTGNIVQNVTNIQNDSSATLRGKTFKLFDGLNATDIMPRPMLAFKLLHDHISVGAYDNSDEYDDMKCFPGTRTALLEYLESWALAPANERRPMIWLDGPMGGGKTAIARSIDDCVSGQNKLLGTFIFRKGEPTRNNTSRFITTLAYQMALSIPLTRPYIEQRIIHDPSIFQHSLSRQLDALILAPLQHLRTQCTDLDPTALPNVLIVDGLDECGGDIHEEAGRKEGQIDVLGFLHRLVQRSDLLPFAILVFSRPERQIKNWFTMEQHASITSRVTLEVLERSSYADIELFVKQSFLKILTTHPSRKNLPRNWPLDTSDLDLNPHEHPDKPWPVVEKIVKRASGQFIYPSIVMKYVASPYHEPNHRLKEILESSSPYSSHSSSDSPNAILDGLYRQLLDSSDVEVTWKIFCILAMFRDPLHFHGALVLQHNSMRKNEGNPHIMKIFGLSDQVFSTWVDHMAPLLVPRIFAGSKPSSPLDCHCHPPEPPSPDLGSSDYAQRIDLISYSLEVFHVICEYLLKGADSQNAFALDGFEKLGHELALLCDFPRTVYRDRVMEHLGSWGGCALSVCFNTIGKSDERIRSWFRFTTAWELAEKVVKRSHIDENIRVSIHPYIKRYLSSPRAFSRFLKWAILKRPPPRYPSLLLYDLEEPRDSPKEIVFPGLSVIWDHLSRNGQDSERLLQILSIPSAMFFEEAFTLFLRRVARGPKNSSVSLRHDAHFHMSFRLLVLSGAVFSYEMWKVLRRIQKRKPEDETAHFYDNIDSIMFCDVNQFLRLRTQPSRVCPSGDFSPLDYALSDCILTFSPYTAFYLRKREYRLLQIAIPTIPQLAHYVDICYHMPPYPLLTSDSPDCRKCTDQSDSNPYLLRARYDCLRDLPAPYYQVFSELVTLPPHRVQPRSPPVKPGPIKIFFNGKEVSRSEAFGPRPRRVNWSSSDPFSSFSGDV